MIEKNLIPHDIYIQLEEGRFSSIDLVDLLTQAKYLFLSRSDPRKSIMASRGLELYPHQIGAAEKILKQPLGHGGILADEVGLGKTIEAGLLIKEYLCKAAEEDGDYRILILGPSSLLIQWQSELREKMGEEFLVYDKRTRDQLKRRHENIWLACPKIICSIDTAKRPEYRKTLEKVFWDLVVIDEAHRLRNANTLAHKLGRELRANRLLLLTATPLQNSLNELYNLISLGGKKKLGALGWETLFKEKVIESEERYKHLNTLSTRTKRIMVRNRRQDLVNTIKELHNVKRNVITLEVILSHPERQLYDAVTEYVKKEYETSKEGGFSSKRLQLISFQRRVCSSVFAIRDSLKKRIEKLEEKWKGYTDFQATELLNAISEIDSEGAELNSDWIEKEQMGSIISKTPPKDQNSEMLWIKDHKEIEDLKKLLNYANTIKKTTKGHIFLKALKKIPKKEKIIIFTEFISTQNYLKDLLDKNGFMDSYQIYNGQMTPQVKEKAIQEWLAHKRILISTDAGSEGRNLQEAIYLFNYDLPWNPMRVEQRIGRIDRLGQRRDVNIFNFTVKDTIEERVLSLLEDKLDLFHQVIGGTGLILGSIKEGKYLERSILEILLSSEKEFNIFAENLKKSRDSFLANLEQTEATWRYFKLGTLQDSMDIKQWKEVLKEEQLKIKWFFQRFIDFLGIRHFIVEKDIYEISTPECFADLVPRDTIWFTFDRNKIYERDYIEFITYGNPIFNQAVRFMLKKEKRVGQKSIPRKIAPFDKPFLVFNFRIRFESLDLVEDEWFALAIDPNSGKIVEADMINWIAPEEPVKAANYSQKTIKSAGESINSYLKDKIEKMAEEKLQRNEQLYIEEMKLLQEYNQGWTELFKSFERRWKNEYQKTEKQIQNTEQPSEVKKEVLDQEIESLEQRLERLNRHYKKQRQKYIDGRNQLKEEIELTQEELKERVKLDIEVEFVSMLSIIPI